MAARDTGRKPATPRRIGGRIAPSAGRSSAKRSTAEAAPAAAGEGGGGAIDDTATLRDERSWYALLLLSALFAIPAALATIAFVVVVNEGTKLAWETLPANLGIPREVLIVGLPTLGGLLVGLILRYMPGGAGPAPAAGHGIGGDEHAGPRVLPGVIAASVVSLVAGASLGPEAPLVTIISALAIGLSARLGLPQKVGGALSIAGISSMLAGIFGSPLASALLLAEGAPFSGRALYRRIFPAVLAGCIGFWVFAGVGVAPAGGAYPAYPGLEPTQILVTVLLAVAAAALGLIFIRVFHLVDARLRPLDRLPVIKALAGGLCIGLVALAIGEDVLFSGEHSVDEVALAGSSVGTLLLILGGKTVTTILSLATGFRGGRIFPVMFLGGTLGAIAATLVPGLPVVLAVGVGMVSAGVAIFRLPLFVVVFAAFFTTPEIVPLLVVAAVVAYIVVDGQPDLARTKD